MARKAEIVSTRFSAALLAGRAVSTVVVAALLLGGCLQIRRDYVGFTPTDLSAIEEGAPRQTVEEVLGPPITGYDGVAGRVETYTYDKGAEAQDEMDAWGAADAVLMLGLEVVFWPIAVPMDLAAANCDDEKQKGLLNVTYDTFGTVVAVDEESYQTGSSCK
jgi:hypothetical protein